MIVDSPELVKLLGEEDSEYPEDSIPYIKVFPHEYVPDTVTTTERFINFDVRAGLNYKNKVYKNLTIYFFVVCHQDVVRYTEKSRECLWYDKVVCELEEILSNQDVFGVGYMKLVDNSPYCPQSKFKGRILTFQSLDYTDGKRYGK